ncbi:MULTISPECIES: hypothetical protein [Halorussus]|uniref:hypothetical protein n=1 Tax=Halorussus TaxID=1070314 RepID=UPI00209FBA5D|nr:hypothetical protein [Halorussus vallis]USZ74471.1 hypothetical protein NGM07_13575 [Halorussus vallis]
MDLIAILLSMPVVSRVLLAPVAVAAAVQRRLGPRAKPLERWRQRLWRLARGPFRLVGGYTTERTTTGEYVCSVDASPETLETHLWRGGFHRNLLAAKKYRDAPERVQWSDSSWVYRDDFLADEQLHVTLFRRPSGVDCYVHAEPSNVTRPLDHWQRRGKVEGDPDRTLRDALAAAGIEYRRDVPALPDGAPAE